QDANATRLPARRGGVGIGTGGPRFGRALSRSLSSARAVHRPDESANGDARHLPRRENVDRHDGRPRPTPARRLGPGKRRADGPPADAATGGAAQGGTSNVALGWLAGGIDALDGPGRPPARPTGCRPFRLRSGVHCPAFSTTDVSRSPFFYVQRGQPG